jgi:SAM-dependent methyltransferase
MEVDVGEHEMRNAADLDATPEGEAVTHSFDRAYWQDHWRHEGEGGPASMASAPPNPYLAGELTDLTPGTALDAGCGAGAEALWLASRGWQVTAVDIAAEALARAAARVPEGGTPGRVRWVEADLSVWSPDEPLDLVMTHYAHPPMPQLDFYRRIAEWVTPGGTLLIVGHRHTHEAGTGHAHGGGDGHGHEGNPPPETTVTAAAVAATLDTGRWHIVTAVERTRTIVGHEGRSITMDDVVLRAVRRRQMSFGHRDPDVR